MGRQGAGSESDGRSHGQQGHAWYVHRRGKSVSRVTDVWSDTDDPELDARLSAIRRQSGLDTKSSLYVLTPVAADDLDDFVQR